MVSLFSKFYTHNNEHKYAIMNTISYLKYLKFKKTNIGIYLIIFLSYLDKKRIFILVVFFDFIQPR